MPSHHPDPITHEILQTWYFSPLLPWQTQTWQYFTQNLSKLPHAILLGGSAGTGKRAFVYRFLAWELCVNKSHNTSEQGACGHCESCQWLISGTHPNILIVPTLAPIHEPEDKKTTKTPEKPKKNTVLSDTSPVQSQTAFIKIDEVRALQGFVQQRSQGTRFVVLHQADSMTVAGANALLKTLEEPAQNVMLFLLSDTPSRLLPTVRSRLQAFEVSKVTPAQGLDFLMRQLSQQGQPSLDKQAFAQVFALSGNAPFVAMDMLTSGWYQQRQLWLNSWQAVRQGARQPIQASDYWQHTLSLSDFLYLSQLMLADITKLVLQISPLQQDISFDKLTPLPSLMAIYTLQQTIEQIWQDRTQHIQEKLCYDRLMVQFVQT